MKRLLIVSDSFGNVSKLDDVLRKHEGEYDAFVHLGNRCYDSLAMQQNIEDMILIRGNLEINSPRMQNIGEFETVFEMEGVKIFATHGHRYSVKSTMIFLRKQSRKLEANLVLFGHTGEKITEFDEDILYFNPGALANNDYGRIIIENGEITSIEHDYLSERW